MSEAEKALMASGVRKPTVIVDWDGTCVPSAWPDRPRKWYIGAREVLQQLLSMGYEVKIHSVRTHSMTFDYSGPNLERDNDIAYIRSMLDEADLEEVEIELLDKPPAVFYIDDRAVRYEGSWLAVLGKITDVHNAGEETKGDVTDVAQEIAQ